MATRQHSSETLKTQDTMPQIDDCMLTCHRTHNHQPTNNMHTQIQLYSEADSATLPIPTGHTEQRTCHMPTHTTLGLVHTRTLRNPSDGRKQSNVCRYWNGTSPISAGRYCEPTHHKHQPQAYVQDGEQRATANHKVRCSTESTPRVPDAPENGVRDSAIQTKTNMDHLQQTRWFQPWRMLKLSLRSVAARH